MNRWLRDFRLVPIVLLAVVGLFVLKSIGLVFDGGYTLGQRLGRGDTMVVTTVPVPSALALQSQSRPLELAGQPSGSRPSWMQEMFNYPDVTGSVARPPSGDTIVTGAAGGAKPEAKDGKAAAGDAPPKSGKPPETRPVDGTVISMEPSRPASAAERALLERLQARRHELEARARELDARESLVKDAEHKLDGRLGDPKTAENRANPGAPRPQEVDAARFKSLVTMYETMKPKDAAKIFDRLDIRVLLEMASQINPRRMSEILALMTPEAAERLTVELASRASGSNLAPSPAELPKIEGRPTGG
jgi:flagellar motility protein MotE (MotC chaperone)